MYLKNRNNYIIVGCLFLLAGVVFFSFGESIYRIDNCRAVVKKYVNADFSETTLETVIDFDGNVSTELDTDYWSELASDTFVTVTENGRLSETSHEFALSKQHSAFYPPMPAHDISFSRESYFDSYSKHIKTDLYVDAINPLDKTDMTQFSTAIHKNTGCINRVGDSIPVKTWFGITYNTDF